MNKSLARILAIGVAVALPTGLFAQSAAAPKPTAAAPTAVRRIRRSIHRSVTVLPNFMASIAAMPAIDCLKNSGRLGRFRE